MKCHNTQHKMFHEVQNLEKVLSMANKKSKCTFTAFYIETQINPCILITQARLFKYCIFSFNQNACCDQSVHMISIVMAREAVLCQRYPSILDTVGLFIQISADTQIVSTFLYNCSFISSFSCEKEPSPSRSFILNAVEHRSKLVHAADHIQLLSTSFANGHVHLTH